MLKQLMAATLSIGASCSGPGQGLDGMEEFVLCNAQPDNAFSIRINFRDLIGIYEDYGSGIGACGDAASGCIDFPMTISIPPRLPTAASPRVDWSVDGYRFRMEPNRERPGTYSMTVQGRQRTGADIGTIFYEYDESGGVVRQSAAGVTTTWVKCAGRLTFADLRTLRQALASPAAP